MKTLLEIKKELIKPVDSFWEDLYKKLYDKLIVGWKYSEKEIDLSNLSESDKDFEKSYLELWISSVLNLPKNKLWENIFKITSESYGMSYHGSGNDNTGITIDFLLNSKEDQLKKIPGVWIYNNYDEVTQFMGNNSLYNRLSNIKTELFPMYTIFIR